ncbi:HD domain-containing protein [Roseospira visakhapatnamensis]|uniref:(P)ppGpp synthase/HD superfamily hydrolase n=1 Tax=Roseospira visakhapatnamensis TaxID=390880 RepID=A0A7W6W7Z0_9PROT|nr:HD domain-containing protein [Roseospira visakhapatnamensis]MBB4264410.1 (p)ppGpp synthase/HD superfamily hydrolase [Roseospira visakhapatnamensis]
MSSPWSQEHYIRAYRFAAEAHWNGTLRQHVPGTDLPYLLHFSLVAMEVIAGLATETDVDGDLAVQCALLHDTLEDTAIGYGDVVAAFGVPVADGVRALSKDPAIGRGLPSPERKQQQMADSLARIRAQPRAVWMVKLADRITNLQPPPAFWSRDKIDRYRDEAHAILVALDGGCPALEARLRQKIAAYG